MSLPKTGRAASLTPDQTRWRQLILLSGPSGVGKGTIVQELLQIVRGLQLCPSATTRGREPRDGEGEYHYVSDDKFKELWSSGQLLEMDPHFSGLYGLMVPAAGVRGISDIDVKGSIRLFEAGLPRMLRIAILPPGNTLGEMVDVCTERMMSSRTDADGIAKRRDRAEEEIGIIMQQWDFDPWSAVVTNDNLDEAVADCARHIANHLGCVAP